MELNLKVDRSRCCRCQACVRDCMAFVLEMKDGYPAVKPEAEARCIRCQHCLAVCPTGALSIFNRDPERSAPCEDLPEPDALLALIKNRRTFRNYRHENLSRATLETLIDALSWSPTGVNDHRLFFAVVDDVDAMDAIRHELSGRLLRAIQSGTLPPELERMKRFQPLLEAGVDVLCRTAPHMLIVAAPEGSPCPQIDPVIALSYFELLAQSAKVGTTWCGLVDQVLRYLAGDLLERFGVPEGYRLGYVMLFGPPNLRYHRATQPTPASVRHIHSWE